MNESQNKGSQDEIDLREVFRYIGDFFLSIWNRFIFIIVSFRKATLKNKYVILGITLVSIVAGIFIVKTEDPYYKSTLLLQSRFLNVRTVEIFTNNLNQINSDTTGNLATYLDIPPEKLESIIRFEFEPFITEEEAIELELMRNELLDAKLGEEISNKLIEEIERLNKGSFKISVFVTDPQAVVGLDSALEKYIKSAPYINKRIEANRTRDLARLDKINEEIPQLDSLRNILTTHVKEVSKSRREGSNNVILGTDEVPSPLTAYQQIMQLNNEKLNLERSLFLDSDFEIIDGFTPSYIPENPSSKDGIIYSTLIGLAVSYLLIFLIRINRWLTKKEKEFDIVED